MPICLQYLQAFAVILIPPIGAWIAWQQVRIGRVKLQHDLFDRRLVVYGATRTFLFNIVTHGRPSDDAIRDFTLGTIDAVFLFNDGIAEYLAEIRKRALYLQSGKMVAESLPVGDERAEAFNKTNSHFLWLVNQLETLTSRFKPFLKLEDLR